MAHRGGGQRWRAPCIWVCHAVRAVHGRSTGGYRTLKPSVGCLQLPTAGAPSRKIGTHRPSELLSAAVVYPYVHSVHCTVGCARHIYTIGCEPHRLRAACASTARAMPRRLIARMHFRMSRPRALPRSCILPMAHDPTGPLQWPSGVWDHR